MMAPLSLPILYPAYCSSMAATIIYTLNEPSRRLPRLRWRRLPLLLDHDRVVLFSVSGQSNVIPHLLRIPHTILGSFRVLLLVSKSNPFSGFRFSVGETEIRL